MACAISTRQGNMILWTKPTAFQPVLYYDVYKLTADVTAAITTSDLAAKVTFATTHWFDAVTASIPYWYRLKSISWSLKSSSFSNTISASHFIIEREIEIPIANIGQGVNKPAEGILGHYAVLYYGVGDDSVFQFEVPHDYHSATDIKLGAHLFCNENGSVTSANHAWQLDISLTPETGGEALDTPTHTFQLLSGDIAIPDTAKHLQEVTMVITGTNVSRHDIVGVQFLRITSSNSPSAPIGLVGVELEWYADPFGEYA